MVGINKFDAKDKRKARRRNHVERDLRFPKLTDRKKKFVNETEDEGYFDLED